VNEYLFCAILFGCSHQQASYPDWGPLTQDSLTGEYCNTGTSDPETAKQFMAVRKLNDFFFPKGKLNATTVKLEEHHGKVTVSALYGFSVVATIELQLSEGKLIITRDGDQEGVTYRVVEKFYRNKKGLVVETTTITTGIFAIAPETRNWHFFPLK
jgi:hypothetical protein